MKPSDALLKRVRQWDESALAEAYDEYAPAIYRYVYRRTGHQDTAQDIVAETFHRLLVALRKGGGPDKQLSAWLYRVAHNLVVDYYRRRPDQEPVTLDDDNVKIVGEHDDVQRFEHQELASRTRAALQLLTPLQQQVVVLRFLEDMSLEEVSNVVGRTVGAVKGLQHRALNSLRRILEVDDASEN